MFSIIIFTQSGRMLIREAQTRSRAQSIADAAQTSPQFARLEIWEASARLDGIPYGYNKIS